MGRIIEARSDAQTACELAPDYVKGYWRLGQACGSMGLHVDAVEAYENALKADTKGDGKSQKALGKELEKARAKIEQERLLVEEGKVTGSSKSSRPSAKPVKAISSGSSTPKVTSKSSSSKGDVVKDKDGNSFTKSEHVRGYKVINGKKTSFFHHEQTEEEKRLIGDITPKQISDLVATKVAITPAQEGTSAWNKAGTWEEKDVTGWAVDTLMASLSGVKVYLPKDSSALSGALVRVTDTEKLGLHDGGHASVATVRGKTRYIYEFGLKLKWEVEPSVHGDSSDFEDCTGSMTFPDIDGTVEAGDEYDLSEFTVDRNISNKARVILSKHVRDGVFRKAIHTAIDNWVVLFRATY